MSVPESDRLHFFVFVVESPSAVDLYHGRGEGRPLSEVLRLGGVETATRVAISREAFAAALQIGLLEEMKARPSLVPILHISAHGYREGIQLSSGEELRWHDLRELLKPINEALEGNLMVCLSTCEGYSGVRMAMYPDDPQSPYFALVGCAVSPTWAETAVAYATLYHLISRGEYIVDAVSAMRTASGRPEFFLETSEVSKTAYIEHLKKLDASKVQAELRETSESQSGTEMSKRRSLERGR